MASRKLKSYPSLDKPFMKMLTNKEILEVLGIVYRTELEYGHTKSYRGARYYETYNMLADDDGKAIDYLVQYHAITKKRTWPNQGYINLTWRGLWIVAIAKHYDILPDKYWNRNVSFISYQNMLYYPPRTTFFV
jgi:hypothetical protein